MKLTIVASNRNRLILESPSSQLFLKSIQWQDYSDFELLIVDGGSQNYSQLAEYFNSQRFRVPMRIIQYRIGDIFERALLNNVGIRNSHGEYVMCTDVDMLFGRKLTDTITKNIGDNIFLESRTMYLGSELVNKIYKGNIDPYTNLESCKIGKIKKRSTAGGLQCTKMSNWNKLKGYNESDLKGWGSEDVELLKRVNMCGINVRWLGESTDMSDVMVFHQPHPKPNLKQDLECQEKNKIAMSKSTLDINKNGWGGIYSS